MVTLQGSGDDPLTTGRVSTWTCAPPDLPTLTPFEPSTSAPKQLGNSVNVVIRSTSRASEIGSQMSE
jgi:hypothetical protein